MGTLLMVRHGQASFMAADYDVLSDLGETQARILGEFWARRGVAPERVYVGPRVRQRRTAEIAGAAARAAGGRWPEAHATLEALDEMQVEQLVRAVLPSLAERDPEVHAAIEALSTAADPREAAKGFQRVFERMAGAWVRGDLEAPGVEPWSDFRARIRGAVTAMTAAGGAVAAFTSGGVVGAAVQLALGLGDEAALALAWRVKNASVAEFVFGRGRLTLDAFNNVAHLEDEALWTHR